MESRFDIEKRPRCFDEIVDPSLPRMTRGLPSSRGSSASMERASGPSGTTRPPVVASRSSMQPSATHSQPTRIRAILRGPWWACRKRRCSMSDRTILATPGLRTAQRVRYAGPGCLSYCPPGFPTAPGQAERQGERRPRRAAGMTTAIGALPDRVTHEIRHPANLQCRSWSGAPGPSSGPCNSTSRSGIIGVLGQSA